MRRILVLACCAACLVGLSACRQRVVSPSTDPSPILAPADEGPRVGLVADLPSDRPPCPPPCPPVCAPLCSLPCESGDAQWHLRGVGGWAFHVGDDEPGSCLYWGGDVGRTFCGCWGIDAFYRTNEARFERGSTFEDGGVTHHVGLKATYERSISGRLYAWAGAGPEYFWTSDYLTDDDGFGVFAEGGLGYVVSKNVRVRAGINVHGFDTDVTRRAPANDGSSRWLWTFAPVVEVEFAF